MTTKEPVTKNGDKSASKSTINGDKRAEALERAEAIDKHCELAHNEPDLLLLAHEFRALHAENEKLKESLACRGVHSCGDDCQNPMCVMRNELEIAKLEAEGWEDTSFRMEAVHDKDVDRLAEARAENEKLTADNAALVKALLDVTEAVNAGECREDEDCDHCHIVHEIILPAVNTRPHPGHALLQRIEKLEAVARAVKGFREHGAAKNGTHATAMFNALEALDVVK